MNMNVGSKDLYLIVSMLLVIGIMFIIYYYFTVECYTDAKILADDIKSEDEYRQCINENSLVEKSTKGKINGCNSLLTKLTANGQVIDNNSPYGKITDLCPVSTLSKTPSDCLEHRIASQTKIMDTLNNEIGNFKAITLNQKSTIDTGHAEHKLHVNSLYANKEISDAVKYINKNRLAIDNDEYNQIFIERTKVTPLTIAPTIMPKKNTPAPIKVSRSID
jgi:hypothetical protein